jgi:hypothetical protein
VSAALVCAWCAAAEEKDAKPKEEPRTAAKSPQSKPALPDWDKVVDGATRMEGLFPLYYNEKEQRLFMEVQQPQYDQEVVLPIAIARGAGMRYLGGMTLNDGDQWLISFHRAADRLLVVRRNVQVRAEAGSPQADSVKVSYNDSVIKALPIRSERENGRRVLIDLADLFMTDLADIGIQPDPARSTWAKVKVFPKNVEIEVSAVFAMRGSFSSMFSGDDVPDARGAQVVIHYGMSMLPATSSYKPRLADDRVGHFLSTVKDFSQDLNETPKMRYVTRWNLEKTNPEAEKSPPKQPIIFWIERTVPREYRQYVREGILEWNKAFEKIGFIDAIQARDQQGADEFDPEDIRYNTIRWISTSRGFAVGPSRTNPKTGEILDADIIFDEGMIRDQREEYLDVAGVPAAVAALASGQRQQFLKRYAADLPALEHLAPMLDRYFADQPQALAELRRPFQAPAQAWQQRLAPTACAQCEMGPGMQRQLTLAAALLAARGEIEPGGKVPEKLIAQAVKEIVMHEVGHTLGLRHNFKASSIYSAQQINDPEFTAKHGNSGSVMDYLPANIARKGEKQGDYFTPTIGPYDYWAIEYAYKPIDNRSKEKEELAKIAGKASDPELAYGTDEDLALNPDPRIQLFDLGEPLEYAKNRIQLVHSGIDDLQDRVVAKGEGWQRARRAFDVMLSEMFRAASLATCYVSGEYTCRDHRDDKDNRAPMKPIELAKQREAIRLLQDEVLSDKAFHFKPELLAHLAPDQWRDNGFGPGESYQYPLLQNVSLLQRSVVSQLLDPKSLRSVQEVSLHAEPGTTLEIAEIFRALTDSIWKELPPPGAAPAAKTKLAVSTIRRNLQREHVARLVRIVLGRRSDALSIGNLILFDFETPPPADARALARQHLREIDGRISAALAQEPDAMTQAHLQELHEQIAKTLNASLQVNEP